MHWNFRKINSLSVFLADCIDRRSMRHGARSTSRSTRIATSLLVAAALFAGQVHARLSPEETEGGGPMTIDDLGFGAALDNQVFGNSYRVTSAMPLVAPLAKSVSEPKSDGRRLDMSTTLEFGAGQGIAASGSPGIALDSADGLSIDDTNIRRFSTALRSSTGTLTVGNDWSNFQDFLDRETPASLTGRGLTSEQISWATSGELGEFSVALEKDYAFLGRDVARSFSGDSGVGNGVNGSSGLVLSWRGTSADQRAVYGISALGRELEGSDPDGSGESTDSGWGVNLAGGWRFGQLFAALSITLGNSIDSFILGKVADSETASEAARVLSPSESININPSLSYRLGENANLHFALNRFDSEAGNAAHGIDTLDTIHLGYSWTPWPSTRIGIEFVGKDVEGPGNMEDSNEVNFAASKRF